MRLLWIPVLACLLPGAASAAAGEHALSANAGYAMVGVIQNDKTQTAQGGAAGLEYERGLDDTFWFRAASAAGLYAGPDGLSLSAAATAGITYRFDVLKYVPYLTLGAGALLVGGGGVERDIRPLFEVGLGLDVLQSRSLSWGVAAHGSAVSATIHIMVGPRVTWRWGFF